MTPANLDEATVSLLQRFAAAADEIGHVIVQKGVDQDAERMRPVAALLASGRLRTRLCAEAGVVVVELVDAATDQPVGELFQFAPPLPPGLQFC
jgi:hypothetical protein